MYLLKSSWLGRRAGWLIAAVAAVPLICISFTGYSWTENHLLKQCASRCVLGPVLRHEIRNSITNLNSFRGSAVWAFGSIPTFSLLLAWQLWYHCKPAARQNPLGRVALTGMALTGIASIAYCFAADGVTREAFVSPMALPYFVLAGLGLAAQAVGWFYQLRNDAFEVKRLILISVGLLATLSGMTVCRESVRIATLGTERFESLYPLHREAFSKSGFPVFLGFFILNAVLIAFCFWLVRTKSVKPKEET